jgi:hypothetical protein
VNYGAVLFGDFPTSILVHNRGFYFDNGHQLITVNL